MRRATQKARVREILRSAGPDGVCGLMLYMLGLPNGRTRVYELRDEDGLLIETVPCPRKYHDAGDPPHQRYVWRWHGDPQQMRFPRRAV